MSILRDFIQTIWDLFSLSNRTTSNFKPQESHYTLKQQTKIPLHIRTHIKNSKIQLNKMYKMIHTLPKEQQYLLRKIHSYCNQIIELVIICPKSYEHLRPFFTGYLQSIFDFVLEFTYLSSQQGSSMELNRKIDVCMHQLHATKQHLEDLFQQGLIFETEDLYQRIHQLNHLMSEDMKRNGTLYIYEEKKSQLHHIK